MEYDYNMVKHCSRGFYPPALKNKLFLKSKKDFLDKAFFEAGRCFRIVLLNLPLSVGFQQ